MNLNDLDVRTTKGDVYKGEDSARLAYQIWLRFGQKDRDALNAWHRLFGNNCFLSDFMDLVNAGKILT
jgi:hypothetical protein